jgi:high-affinity iron transporter
LLIIPLHRLFSVTDGLVALLAAVMAGQAAELPHSVEILLRQDGQLWNTSFIVGDGSMVGRSRVSRSSGCWLCQ